MMGQAVNIFRVPELRKRIVYTCLLLIVYRIGSDAGGPALIREEFLWRSGRAEPLQRETLLPLTEARFAFAAHDAQGQLVWMDTWDGDTHGIPPLVRFTCTVPLPGRPQGLTLVRFLRNPSGLVPVKGETL